MTDYQTSFMGIALKNPIIIGACSLSTNENKLKKLEQAGAAAIVYKSLFEEQIQLENLQMDNELQQYDNRHAEMARLHPSIEHAGPKEHLYNLKKAKKALNIPLFASLNAIHTETWLEYAHLIEETGVDGIELNLYALPNNKDVESSKIEKQQIELLTTLRKTLSIPIAVKLSPAYTNPVAFIKKVDQSGINGLVLFNRLFQPDIDIHTETHTSPFHLSREGDYGNSLRFAGLLYDEVKADICSSTGIMSGDDIIRLLLAGSDCVQIVSAIYRYKTDIIAKMLEQLTNWMQVKNYHSLNDFKGNLSRKQTKDPYVYKRGQYIDLLLNSEKLLPLSPIPA